MRRIFAALAVASAMIGAPATAGVYVDVAYSGTATGHDAGGYFGPDTYTPYTDTPFELVFKFYEDDGPEQDYSLGAALTINGQSYVIPGTGASGDLIAYGIRYSGIQLGWNTPTGWRQAFVQGSQFLTGDGITPITPYAEAGTGPSVHNYVYLAYRDGSEFGHAHFSLNTTSLVVTTQAGSPPACCETSLTGIVPEPATWALMILGFSAAGTALRRRKARVSLGVSRA